jgi:hypothetical protein
LRQRVPAELETDGAGTAALAFDQFPSWDPAAAPSSPAPVQPLRTPVNSRPPLDRNERLEFPIERVIAAFRHFFGSRA